MVRPSGQVGGIDVRVPLLIVAPLAFVAGTDLTHQQIGAVATGRMIVRTARAIDGDTIEIHRVPDWLDSIDAPELAQSCTRDGVRHPLAAGRRPSTPPSSIGSDGIRSPVELQHEPLRPHPLAICFEAGEDLNGLMVRDGQAVVYRQYLQRYVGAEDAARVARQGIWATDFEPPSIGVRGH